MRSVEDVPPGVYRHYKGGLYRVLFVATESTNRRAGGKVVVYVSLTTGRAHARDLAEFVDIIDVVTHTRRFEYIGEVAPNA